MKKIYYAIVEEIEVDENLTEDEIDDILAEKANGKSYMWSEEERKLLE